MPEFPRIDKYPQFFGFHLESSAVNVATEIRISLPKYRFGLGTSTSSVVCWEFLKIELFPKIENTHSGGCDFTISGTTASHAGRVGDDFVSSINEGDNIFYTHGYYTTPVYNFHQEYISGGRHTCDLQFNDGRGVPIASDYLYVQIVSANYDAPFYVDGRVWYRFIKLGLPEYIGLLQQQQTPEQEQTE